MPAFSICKNTLVASLLFASIALAGCNSNNAVNNSDTARTSSNTTSYLSQPLVTSIYTADPSAHLFRGKIYIYPSHDTNTGAPEKDDGSHFAMSDYHILSMDAIPGAVTDNGVALNIKDIPWAGSCGRPMQHLKTAGIIYISR